MTIEIDMALCAKNAPNDAVSYAMRTECQSDAFVIRAALADWVYTWSEEWDVWDGNRAPPDMAVRFQLAWTPPSYSELQWLVSSLEDCHVAAQSLRPEACYTGERTSYEELFASMTRPCSETIRQAKAGIERTLKWLPVLRSNLVPQRQRLAAELGKPKAYLAREEMRLTRFWEEIASEDDPRMAAAAGRFLAQQTWNERPHR